MTDQTFHIHLVSDATGETINSMARAGLAQFEGAKIEEHHWTLIRTKRQLDMVMEGLRQWPGLVLYTMTDETLRLALAAFCRKESLQSVSVMDPILASLSNFLGQTSTHAPGRQHVLDESYFARIDAMDFALAFDDGNKADHLDEADILLLGVSRTSKTPTCLYLANRGFRAANIPIVPGLPLPIDPEKLEGLEKPLVVGLTQDPDQLVSIRRTRIQDLHQQSDTHYVDPEKVREELLFARRLFARIGCPVLDVSRRSVEETAAEIILLLNKRALEKACRDKVQAGRREAAEKEALV